MAKSDNLERENRILDAAVGLFVHYGYDKTTVNDIARKAGVSQGTIYLHFESKNDLLEKLILRETQGYAEEWLARIDADPDGGTLAGMYKNALYALSGSEFMGAMMRQDGRVLGSYLRRSDNFLRAMRDAQPESPRYQFVKLMQEAGAMRADLDPKVVAHIMDMLAYGLIALDDIADRATFPPLEDVIEGIAAIMDRALTPEGDFDRNIGKVIVRNLANASLEQYDDMQHLNQEQNDE